MNDKKHLNLYSTKYCCGDKMKYSENAGHVARTREMRMYTKF